MSTLESQNSEPATQNYFPLFPRDRFTLLIGDPGTGKSLLATHLAARRSLRVPMPPGPFIPNPVTEGPDVDLRTIDNHPGFSIICSMEDDDETIKYRLSIASDGNGADFRFIDLPGTPSLVFREPDFATGPDDPERTLCPLIARLTRMVHAHQPPGLLILDPIPAFLENLDAANNAAIVRRVLTPLLNFGTRYGMTIVGISHLAKTHRSRNAVLQAASSVAYAALARSVLLLTHDTLTNNPMRRLLIPVKNSFARPQAVYPFTLHNTDIEGLNIPFPYITFDPEPIRNHPLLPGCTLEDTPIKDSALELAETFLRTTLLEGPIPSARLLCEARSLGISLRTFDRARENLGAVSFRTSKCWFTHLPNLALPDYAI